MDRTNVAITHPYHEGKLCSKFGLIPPIGLGGDRVMNGRGCLQYPHRLEKKKKKKKKKNMLGDKYQK